MWGLSGDITTRTVDRHVASLRKKIDPTPNDDPTCLKTVYGIGYRFMAEESAESSAASEGDWFSSLAEWILTATPGGRGLHPTAGVFPDQTECRASP